MCTGNVPSMEHEDVCRQFVEVLTHRVQHRLEVSEIRNRLFGVDMYDMLVTSLGDGELVTAKRLSKAIDIAVGGMGETFELIISEQLMKMMVEHGDRINKILFESILQNDQQQLDHFLTLVTANVSRLVILKRMKKALKTVRLNEPDTYLAWIFGAKSPFIEIVPELIDRP